MGGKDKLRENIKGEQSTQSGPERCQASGIRRGRDSDKGDIRMALGSWRKKKQWNIMS